MGGGWRLNLSYNCNLRELALVTLRFIHIRP